MAQPFYHRKRADYLNRQAERFRRLARDAAGEQSRESLLRLADEFVARASARENDDTAILADPPAAPGPD
jgi:hypothetical protein